MYLFYIIRYSLTYIRIADGSYVQRCTYEMAKKNFYSDFNSKFYIKIYGCSNGHTYNQLASIHMLRDILGKVLCDTILGKAYYSDLEKITFKFRRGLKVTFYAK